MRATNQESPDRLQHRDSLTRRRVHSHHNPLSTINRTLTATLHINQRGRQTVLKILRQVVIGMHRPARMLRPINKVKQRGPRLRKHSHYSASTSIADRSDSSQPPVPATSTTRAPPRNSFLLPEETDAGIAE